MTLLQVVRFGTKSTISFYLSPSLPFWRFSNNVGSSSAFYFGVLTSPYSDKHGARPPSCSPHCKSSTVTSVCQTDYPWHYWIGIHHHLHQLDFCGEMLGGRSIAKAGSSSHTLVVSHILETLTWLVALFILLVAPYMNGLYFLLQCYSLFLLKQIRYVIFFSSVSAP